MLLNFRVFSQSRSGTLYRIKTWIALGDPEAEGVSLKLPCVLRVGMRKRVTITDVPGLPDTVKQVQGLSGYEISITTWFGDYDPPVFSSHDAITANDELRALNSLISQDGPVKIVDEEGLLSSLGISYVVFSATPMEIDQDPTKPGVLNVSLSCYSELMPDTGALEMLTLEEPL